MKKLFVSLPMGGREEEDILQDMAKFAEIAEKFVGERLELIPTYMSDIVSQNLKNRSLWMLGVSLKFLSEADLVVFAPGSKRCRGCKIERLAAQLYRIPTLDISTYGVVSFKEN